jgi:hypothetical protein
MHSPKRYFAISIALAALGCGTSQHYRRAAELSIHEAHVRFEDLGQETRGVSRTDPSDGFAVVWLTLTNPRARAVDVDVICAMGNTTEKSSVRQRAFVAGQCDKPIELIIGVADPNPLAPVRCQLRERSARSRPPGPWILAQPTPEPHRSTSVGFDSLSAVIAPTSRRLGLQVVVDAGDNRSVPPPCPRSAP